MCLRTCILTYICTYVRTWMRACVRGASFFPGYARGLGWYSTISFCGLGSRVRVTVLGSVNSNHNHNPKYIYNPKPYPNPNSDPNPILKLTFRKYPSIHTNYIISHSTILQYNHNIWYGSYVEKKYWWRKTMISTRLPYLVRRKSHFKWNCCTDFFCQLILVHNGLRQHFPEGVQNFVQWHFLKSNMAAATSLNH